MLVILLNLFQRRRKRKVAPPLQRPLRSWRTGKFIVSLVPATPPIPTARAAPRTPGPPLPPRAAISVERLAKPPPKGNARRTIRAQFATLVQAAQPSVPLVRHAVGARILRLGPVGRQAPPGYACGPVRSGTTYMKIFTMPRPFGTCWNCGSCNCLSARGLVILVWDFTRLRQQRHLVRGK